MGLSPSSFIPFLSSCSLSSHCQGPSCALQGLTVLREPLALLLAPFLHLLRAGELEAAPPPPRTLKVEGSPMCQDKGLRPSEYRSPSCSSYLHFSLKMGAHSSTFFSLREGVSVRLEPGGSVTALGSR